MKVPAFLKEKYIGGRYNYFLILQSSLLTLFVFQIWVEAFYLGRDFSSKIGWKAADGTDGISGAHVGVHYFSDYSQMIHASEKSNPWETPNVYPPFSVLIFKFFSMFNSNLGLSTWLFLSALLMVAPLYLARRSGLNPAQFILTAVIMVLSSPYLATLDRGNQIAVIPILILLFYLTHNTKKSKTAGIFLAFAISIKIYPVILLLYLLRTRDWRTAFWTIIFTIIITSTSLIFFVYPENNSLDSFKWLGSHSQIAKEAQPMLFSLVGILHNVIVYFQDQTSETGNEFLQYSNLISGLLVLLVFSISRNRYGIYSFLPFLYCLQLVPLQSYTYSRVWVFAALPLVIMAGPSKLKVIWLAIIGLNISPFVIWIRDEVNLLPTLGVLIFIPMTFYQVGCSFKIRLKNRKLSGLLAHPTK